MEANPATARPVWPPPAVTCYHLPHSSSASTGVSCRDLPFNFPPTRSFCPAPFGLSPMPAAPADPIFWVLSSPSCLPQVPKLHLLVSPCQPPQPPSWSTELAFSLDQLSIQ